MSFYTDPEDILRNTYGPQNEYISEDTYIKRDEVDDYIFNLENNLENDLIEQALSNHNDEYYGIIGTEKIYDYDTLINIMNRDEVDRNELIHSSSYKCKKKSIMISSTASYYTDTSRMEQFCLYNIYLEVEKADNEKFTKEDIYNLFNIKIDLIIGETTINSFNLLIPIIKSSLHNVSMIHDNIFFVELFDFNKLNNGLGISQNLLRLHDVRIKLTYDNKLQYIPNYIFKIHNRGKNIDLDTQHKVFQSKKNILKRNKINNSYTSSIYEKESYENLYDDNKTDDMKKFSNEVIISSHYFKYNLYNNNIFEVFWSHPTQFIIFYILNPKINDDLDSSYRTIQSIGMNPNGAGYINWDLDDLIQIEILNIPLYILCLDPQLKDGNKFKNYLDGKINNKTCVGVNFSKINKLFLKIDIDDPFEDNKNYELSIFTLHSNIIDQMNGMIGLGFYD